MIERVSVMAERTSRHGVLKIGDGVQRGIVKPLVVNQSADGALAAGDLAGDVVNVGNGPADMAAVLLHEIRQRAEQIVNFVAGETLAQIRNAGGGLVELGHDGVDVGLFFRRQHGAVHDLAAARRAETRWLT